MSDWQYSSLGEILPFKYGKGLPKRKRSGTGEFNVVSSAGITGTHSIALTSEPCVVIGRKGTIGSLHYCPEPVWPIDTTFYVTGSEQIELRYAYYLLHTLPLATMNNDSAIPGLNRSQAEAIKVCIPDIAEQRRIAEVLGALDDKIESNRRIAVKCDEVASELFGQAASMNQKLDEVSEVRMGVSPPGFSYNETGEGIAFFQGVRDFSYLHPVARVYTNAPKRLAKPGDILFSVRAPVGRLNIADSTCCIGRGLAAITSNRSAICLFALRAAAAEWEKFSAEGTVFGAVNQKSLKSTLIPWPDPVAEEELEDQLSSLVALASQSERESISLSKLRDTLLPELMSGRMRVDEAGRLVSEALDEEVADV